jgi:hypothetical protein
MAAVLDTTDPDLFMAWINGKAPKPRHHYSAGKDGLRFAFYGIPPRLWLSGSLCVGSRQCLAGVRADEVGHSVAGA